MYCHRKSCEAKLCNQNKKKPCIATFFQTLASCLSLKGMNSCATASVSNLQWHGTCVLFVGIKHIFEFSPTNWHILSAKYILFAWIFFFEIAEYVFLNIFGKNLLKFRSQFFNYCFPVSCECTVSHISLFSWELLRILYYYPEESEQTCCIRFWVFSSS